MAKSNIYLFALLIGAFCDTFAHDCYNTPTSEGLVTLQDGHFACAALRKGQQTTELGKNYVICVDGKSVVMPCPPNLRWDTSVNTCNYAQHMNCELPNMDKLFTFPIDKTTSTTTTEHRETVVDETSTLSQPTIQLYNTSSDLPETTRKMEESTQCVGAITSEGLRTLQHGQKACAPLRSAETSSELGKRFVTCSSGAMYTQQCQNGLRYDTAMGYCNWPGYATCELPVDDNIYSTRSPRPTTDSVKLPKTTSQSTSKPITLPRTTSRTIRTTTPPRRTSQPQNTGPCNSDNCKLPNCFCFGDIPSTIPHTDMPMFIMLTFDDAVSTYMYNLYYRALLVDNDYQMFNPTGCRPRSTLYVSHQDTDYTKVIASWEAGNEIGSHTIHHSLPQGDKNSDYSGMVAEIEGLKKEMLKATGNKTLVDSILGFRAPYLRVAGDVQYDVLRDYGFLYDTSILNINILKGMLPHWPFTLDFVIGECVNPPCPTKAYPGLWEVPLNGWIGDDGEGCSMVDACNVGVSPWSATEEEWYNFYDRNFRDYFENVKVPMPIFTHGFMFSNYPNSYPALASWLQDILLIQKDVWLVTPAQVIQWMKQPLSNSEMIAQKWGC